MDEFFVFIYIIFGKYYYALHNGSDVREGPTLRFHLIRGGRGGRVGGVFLCVLLQLDLLFGVVSRVGGNCWKRM